MNEFLKMDVFFVVATFSLLLLTALLAFAIWRLLRILKHVERIAEIAGKEAENIRSDAAYVRGKLMGAVEAMFAFIPRRKKPKRDLGEVDDEY